MAKGLSSGCISDISYYLKHGDNMDEVEKFLGEELNDVLYSAGFKDMSAEVFTDYGRILSAEISTRERTIELDNPQKFEELLSVMDVIKNQLDRKGIDIHIDSADYWEPYKVGISFS